MPVLPEYSLQGKVAMIAGMGGDSTAILADALSEAGARVFIMARPQPVVEVGLGLIAERGGQALGSMSDPTSTIAVEQEVKSLLALWGRVDILVNNFQTQFAKPFEQVTPEEWDEVMQRNLRSVFVLTSVVGKQMLQQGNGRIINIVSGLAERGLANMVPYCASQGAVLQLTRALAVEWARRNIRVNAIGMGWFSSEEVPAEEAQKELLVRYIPLRRKGHPRDIAPLMVYLASDACKYTSGQPIYVDGGLMSHA